MLSLLNALKLINFPPGINKVFEINCIVLDFSAVRRDVTEHNDSYFKHRMTVNSNKAPHRQLTLGCPGKIRGVKLS